MLYKITNYFLCLQINFRLIKMESNELGNCIDKRRGD